MKLMKRSIVFIVSMFLFSSPLCHAQTDNDNLFSLDLSYSLSSLLNHGWGIGLNYEKKLFDFLSVKGNVGHMTFLTGIEDVYNTSLMIDVSIGYKFIIASTQNYNEIKNYVNPGFRFGLNFSIFLNKITRGNKDDQND